MGTSYKESDSHEDLMSYTAFCHWDNQLPRRKGWLGSKSHRLQSLAGPSAHHFELLAVQCVMAGEHNRGGSQEAKEVKRRRETLYPLSSMLVMTQLPSAMSHHREPQAGD